MGLTKCGVIKLYTYIYITYIYIISQISASLMGKMMKIDRAEQNRMLKTQGTLLASDIQHPIVGESSGFETNTLMKVWINQH